MLNIPAGWKPIDSAPKTGRTLLLGYWNSHGKWRTVRGQWMSAEYIGQEWDEPDGVEAGWFEAAVEADDVPNCWPIEPTHWMPLPAAPGSVSPSAPGDAQDERHDPIALDRLADYIADNWPDKKYSLEEICQRLNATWPGAFMPAAPAAGDALDAARYRELRNNVWVAGSEFRVMDPKLRYVAPRADVELDAFIDAVIATRRKGEA